MRGWKKCRKQQSRKPLGVMFKRSPPGRPTFTRRILARVPAAKYYRGKPHPKSSRSASGAVTPACQEALQIVRQMLEIDARQFQFAGREGSEEISSTARSERARCRELYSKPDRESAWETGA